MNQKRNAIRGLLRRGTDEDERIVRFFSVGFECDRIFPVNHLIELDQINSRR